MFSTVVAVDSEYGIAKNGKIPWYFSEDLKFFKELTVGHVIIMGRKTYESIGKALPGRINIVISTTNPKVDSNVLIFNDLWDCVKHCLSEYKDKQLYVIGGSRIYNWFIENRLIGNEYITLINNNYSCDTFYPNEISIYKKNISDAIISELYECNDYKRYKIQHMNKEEQKFLNLGISILNNGNNKSDRTGVGTLSLFGKQLEFDLSNNTFPLLTTRKMFFRGIFEELMLYLRGQTDSSILEEKGVNVWKGNTTREFLDVRGLQCLPIGDMGPSYGFLFRYFGAEYKTCKFNYTGQGYDQLYNVIHTIKTNPNDRRLVISLWDPYNINKCPLPPCLYNYQFYVNDGKLSCMMTQRSSDFVVAGGWNIATGALLTYLIASVTGLMPYRLIWNIGDVHVYNNLIEQMNEQLTRNSYLFPKIFITKKEKIEDYEFTDIKLLGYKYHESIRMTMNV